MKTLIQNSALVAALTFASATAVPAQTCDVTWRKIDNPHVISGTVTIPAGQTVCVEPGVIVQFTSNGQLHLLGNLIGTGAAADRITLVAQNSFPNRVEVVGTLDLQFADIFVLLNINAGGSFFGRDSSFGRLGMISSFDGVTSHIDTRTRFVSLENAVFDSSEPTQSFNASIFGGNFTATLQNVSFRNSAFLFVNTSYLFIDGLSSQNSPTDGLVFNQNTLQPTFFDNFNIANSAGAGLLLDAGNFEIGPNVTIQNTEYPVKGSGGLMPGSHIPATGNRNNWIETGQVGARDTVYAPQSLPYVLDLFRNIGGVEILPGTTFKARENFAFHTESGPLRALGLPNAPITIEPFIPGQKWTSGQFNSSGDRLEYVVLDGSELGIVSAGGSGAIYWIDNSILRNHDRALANPNFYFAFLQGNLFANNGIAITADSGIRASGKTNPNLFENNATAMNAASAENVEARYNWWNSPTGPTAQNNPGGTGELINGLAQIFPFRTARPDTTDHPPVVRMPRVPYRFALGNYQGLLDFGTKQILTWEASDDGQIVKQKILFSNSSNSRDRFTLVADNLPASQRNFELTVPGAGFQVAGSPFVRVVAVDDQGQEGFDEWQVNVPSGEETGTLQITSNVAGQVFRGGHEVPLTWTVTTPFLNNNYNAFLILDADRRIISLGGGNSSGSFLTPKMPLVSTDSARFAVSAYGTSNRQRWFFSPPFAIRPDPRYIDAAPQISLNSPAPGQQFSAGSVVPITWTATDDEAIRQFNIQVSTDEGRTWLEIAANLPPGTTNYDWQLPPNGSAINDVRVRVIAADRRFQNSSDGQTRSFSITAPPNAAPAVQITYPANNSNVEIGKSAFFTANATDSDGTIQRVEFYQTTNVIGIPGVLTTTLIGSDTTAPYQVAWDTYFTGNFTVTARAYDNRDAIMNSSANNFSIVMGGGQAPLPINPPELDIPSDGQNFPTDSDITLRAAPGTGSRPIVRMDFYNGTTLIGSDTTAPYEIVWNDVPAGNYALFARTIANNGAEATSKQADISVGTSTPTPTPAPTTTPTPTPTSTPVATATPSATPVSTPLPTPTPTPTTSPGVTPTPAPTFTPGATPTPISTPAPTTTPGATPPSTPSPAPTVTPGATPTPPAQAINLSTRMRVLTGDNVGIGGLIITGSAPKRVLIRAIGPSLTQSGVPNALLDPVLELHGPGSFVTLTNDNWKEDPVQRALIESTGIPPASDLESAIEARLIPGAYTAIVRGNGNTSGVALVEAYDLDQSVSSKLDNISTRALISTGDDIVIAGFMLGQGGTDKVVVRGIGPSLTNSGVPNALADPTLELRNGNGALLVANNDWQDDPMQASALTAAGLVPPSHLESGVVMNLSPGLYTALLAGGNNGGGIGLVEVYAGVAP